MSGPRLFLLLAPFLAAVSGCATIAVYEPSTTAEISLTAQQSELHKAADAFGQESRRKGLATGEASLGQLASMLSGKQDDSRAYWKKIGADKSAPQSVVSRVRADLGDTVSGLTNLNTLARRMMAKTQPAKTDVAEFEKALIHARQARDSFSDAIAHVNKRSARMYEANDELAALDTALASARSIADEMAANRAEPVVAGTPAPKA